MRKRRRPWLPAVAAAAVAAAAGHALGAGCGSSPGETPCGREVRPGEYRFCAAGGEQRCVCAVNRCAHPDVANCRSGWRYAYGDGACVPEEHLDSLIPSSSVRDQCPAGDADADADAPDEGDEGAAPDEGADGDAPDEGARDDGRDEAADEAGPEAEDEGEAAEEGAADDVDDVAEADEPEAPDEGTVDADVAETEDAPEDGDGEADATSPTVGPAVALGQGQDPRPVPFAGEVLVDYVDQRVAGELRDSVYFEKVPWDPEGFAPLGTARDASGDGDTDARLDRAWAWSPCSVGVSDSYAVFWHEREAWTGRDRFWILRVAWDGTGLVIDDITSLVLPEPPGGDYPTIEDARVVGDGTRCFVAWLEDPDGPAGGARWEAHYAVVTSSGVTASATPLIEETGDWEIRSWVEDGERLGLMATPDGYGGLVVASPFVNDVIAPARFVLLAQRVNAAGDHAWSVSEGEMGGRIIFETAPGSGATSLETPAANAIAVAGGSVVYAQVIRRDVDTCLYFGTVLLADGATTIPTVPIRPCGLSRFPTLAVGAGSRVYVTRWEWGGEFMPPADGYVFRPEMASSTDYLVNPAGRVTVLPHVFIDPAGGPMFTDLSGDTFGDLRFNVQRLTTDLEPYPGWSDGATLTDLGVILAGEDLVPPPPLPAPDGGVLAVWSEEDLGTSVRTVRVRRLFAAP
jgi:hypothetical protein